MFGLFINFWKFYCSVDPSCNLHGESFFEKVVRSIQVPPKGCLFGVQTKGRNQKKLIYKNNIKTIISQLFLIWKTNSITKMKLFYTFLAVVSATETTVATTTETTLANLTETTAVPASTVSIESGNDDYNMSYYMPTNMTTEPSPYVCAQYKWASVCSTSQVRGGNLYRARLKFWFPILNQATVDKMVCESAQHDRPDVAELWQEYIDEKGITCESNNSNGFLVNSISIVLVAMSAIFK